jgi:poly(hydroxyalkanoate) depolymerase family esterase
MFDSTQMLEATRLTQAGRLNEATALIQRLLHGGAAGPASAGSPPTIDVTPDAVEFAEPPQAKPSAPLHNMLQGLVGRLRGKGKAEPLPEGAAFQAHSFINAAGTRAYKLYVPGRPADGPRPLVVMLHGCTQSPDDFAAGTRMNALAEEFGLLVAYPEQPNSANCSKCWNWFSAEHQQRGTGEPSLIAGITRQILRDHDADAGRVYIAGLSAGGAAAAVMAAAYPDLYAAAGVHSGLPCGSARDLPSAFAAMRQATGGGVTAHEVPTIVFHGDQDSTVHPRNGAAVAAQVKPRVTATASAERGQVPGGHAYTRTLHTAPSGAVVCEEWTIHGAGHAWAGGATAGTYTDPQGPDASRAMLEFFLQHRRG